MPKAKYLIMIAMMCMSISVWANQSVTIKEERGVYQLNFESTYVTYIHNDIEMCVTLPKDYVITAVMPGSPDFLSVAVLQNRLYISKATPDKDIMTNLSVHIKTDEGVEKELFFKLKSSRSAPKVLAIQFEKPNYSELNATIEAIKNRYTEQLQNTLSVQEKEVQDATKLHTIINSRHWFIKSKHGEITAESKGASASLMGVINFEGSTYIYIRGNDRNGECEIIRLEDVKVGKQKYVAEYVGEQDTDDERYKMKVFRIPEVQFRKKRDTYKNLRWTLYIRIWSELHTAKFKAQ